MGLSTFIFFSFFLFSATILSGPYLWNRYSQRLQIECAAWSCGLVVHCCLPSNSLRYFLFFLFIFFFAKILSGPYLWNHYSQRLQIDCAACCLVVTYEGISLELLLAETPNWVCCLFLRSNFALLLTIQFASLLLLFFFRHDFVRAIRAVWPSHPIKRQFICDCLILVPGR